MKNIVQRALIIVFILPVLAHSLDEKPAIPTPLKPAIPMALRPDYFQVLTTRIKLKGDRKKKIEVTISEHIGPLQESWENTQKLRKELKIAELELNSRMESLRKDIRKNLNMIQKSRFKSIPKFEESHELDMPPREGVYGIDMNED